MSFVYDPILLYRPEQEYLCNLHLELHGDGRDVAVALADVYALHRSSLTGCEGISTLAASHAFSKVRPSCFLAVC